MLKTLMNLGFTESESQIYVFLTTEDPTKTGDISEALKMQKNQLYRSLKSLQLKGIVTVSQDGLVRFSAVPFEKVLDCLVKAKIEQQKALQESKEELLSTWQAIIKKDKLKS